jgi:hypothetical protein
MEDIENYTVCLVTLASSLTVLKVIQSMMNGWVEKKIRSR